MFMYRRNYWGRGEKMLRMTAKVQAKDEKSKKMIREVLKNYARSIPQIYDGWIFYGIPLSIKWEEGEIK